MPSDNLNELLNTFYQNYDCRITLTERRMIKCTPMGSFWDVGSMTATQAMESERVYQIEIPESEMRHMMIKLKEIDRHEQIQHRYPQLKLAYMDYLTQVHLTVDNPHNY